MPFYDYICQNCGHEMEVMHSVHGRGPSACPNCGGEMKKAISAPAVHFKGSGWARKERTGRAARPADDPGSAKEKTSASNEGSSNEGSSGERSSGEGSATERSSNERSSTERSSTSKSDSGNSPAKVED